jgi:predicted acyl esterase
MVQRVAGTEPRQRQLNGAQTTGRAYRNLSQPQCELTREDDVPVPMRDGVRLLADVFRPTTPGRYPVLIAASPYPRQIQDIGAPLGFIEAGASDFFVPRGRDSEQSRNQRIGRNVRLFRRSRTPRYRSGQRRSLGLTEILG